MDQEGDQETGALVWEGGQVEVVVGVCLRYPVGAEEVLRGWKSQRG